MKKLVLKLGLTTMAVLPIVAVASCSSTTPEVPTIDTEVKNFEKTFPAKEGAQSTTTQKALETLNGSGSAQEKWTYLSSLVELPQINSNFIYEVQSATIAADSKTSVVVTIKISEKSNTTNTKTAQLIISQLTQSDSPLETEVKRFNVSAPANDASKSLKATAVIEEINKLQDGAKLVKLQEYTTVPNPSQGFSIKVVSAKIGSEDTSIEVKISVTEDATSQSLEATFTVTGFATLTPQEKFESQVALLVNQEVLEGKKSETPSQAKTAMTKENLKEYYKPISLLYGVTYEYLSSEPNATTKTTLDVTLTVKSNVDGVTDTTKKVEITGFTSPQTILAEKAKLITDKPVLTAKVGETAATAATAITDDTKLKEYYSEVALGEGFSYTLKTGSVQAVGDTVKVTVTVSSTDTNTTPIEHPFIITGFKRAVDVVAETFTTSARAKNTTATTRQIITGINETSATQEAKLKALAAIVDLPQLTSGFTIEVGLASQATVETSVNVKFTILQTDTENKAEATFTITNLTTETLQQEIDRLATTNLVDKPVLEGKESETAAQASTAITSIETLSNYYTLIPLPKEPAGISYVYGTNVVEGDTVKVTVSVSSTQEGIKAASKTFVISGFKTRELVALETEAESKLGNRTVLADKNTQTAVQAKAAITSDQTLNLYYRQTSLINRYRYAYGGKSEVNKTDSTILDVTLKVFNFDDSIRIFKVVQISGFTALPPLEAEALKFSTSLPAKDSSLPTTTAIRQITEPENNDAKLAALKSLVTGFPELSANYTLTVGSATADTTTPSSVNVQLTIADVEAPSRASQSATFTITGLTAETPQEELTRVATLIKSQTVLEGKANETAAIAAKKMNQETLSQYYEQVPMPKGISYIFKSAVASGNRVTITVEVVSTDTSLNRVPKTARISGFKAPTALETEAVKLWTSLAATDSATQTSAVIEAINVTATDQPAKLAKLKSYVTGFPEISAETYTLEIGTATVDENDPTSVNVPIKVSKKAVAPTAGEEVEQPVDVIFTITGLTKPSAE